MGKFKITARVVGPDGPGEIVDKRKGERLVRPDDKTLAVTWVAKSSLRLETSEQAYSVGEGGADKWVPKVGDRVTLKRESVWFTSSNEGVGTIFPKKEAASAEYVGVKFDGYDFLWHIEPSDLEPVVAPATTATTIPIGTTVTFTATGRLSAINENGHHQVTFPGLPSGRNSFALPAEYVAAA